MKKGIVRVPEWAKEAFKSGVREIRQDCVYVDPHAVEYDGKEVTIVDHFTYGKPMLGGRAQYEIPKRWIEPIEEHIQWDRVKVDAPIEILSDGVWVRAHFRHMRGEFVTAFANGLTSYTQGKLPRIYQVEQNGARFPKGVNPEDWYKDE